MKTYGRKTLKADVMEKDRGTPSPRSSRSRKLPSLGATQKSVDVRTGLDSSGKGPEKKIEQLTLVYWKFLVGKHFRTIYL